MKTEQKLCPYRIHGKKTAQQDGQYHYSDYKEYFMPCIEEKCPCYRESFFASWCVKNGEELPLGTEYNQEGGNQ